MENLRGRRGRAQAAAPGESSLQITYEEFQPSFDWTHDSINHVLLLDLPGFKKEDLKVQVDSLGKLTISGERREGEGKYRRFKQVFDVPSDSITEKISGKFEHGLLFVIMPLKVGKEEERPKPTQKEEPKKEDAAIGKESLKKEEKPTQKQEPEKEDAAIGKESLKNEEKPTQKQEPKNEDAAFGKESTKKEEKPTDKEKEKEKPKREDGAIGKDRTKTEEKPIHSHKEEPKKDDGAIGKDGTKTKKEEKPMLKLKEEAKKEDGVRTKKIDAEGDKHVQGDKKDSGIVDSSSIKKQEERGWGRRKEEREAMAMAMEGEEGEEDSERGLFQTVVEQINKNKAVIAVAALAFSFGVYLSRKLR